jgi:hypothetical protein
VRDWNSGSSRSGGRLPQLVIRLSLQSSPTLRRWKEFLLHQIQQSFSRNLSISRPPHETMTIKLSGIRMGRTKAPKLQALDTRTYCLSHTQRASSFLLYHSDSTSKNCSHLLRPIDTNRLLAATVPPAPETNRGKSLRVPHYPSYMGR